MKWFKHDANANADSKLQNVLLDYGLEGYGLYWYCIELIAGKVEADINPVSLAITGAAIRANCLVRIPNRVIACAVFVLTNATHHSLLLSGPAVDGCQP